MCVEFIPPIDLDLIEDCELSELLIDRTNPQQRVFPGHAAPVIFYSDSKLTVKEMKFGLIPEWSQSEKVRFANYNCRIESAFHKPAWRDAIASNRCIIPIQYYYEPISSGPNSGTVVRISDMKGTPMLVAGIFNIWREVAPSFALLTEQPDHFTSKLTHDRQPILLTPSQAKSWCQLGTLNQSMALERLSSAVLKPVLTAEFDRYLKQGRQLNLL